MEVAPQTLISFWYQEKYLISWLVCLFVSFEQIIDIEHDPTAGDSLEYDAEWIAVLKATNSLINVTQSSWSVPENNGLHAK